VDGQSYFRKIQMILYSLFLLYLISPQKSNDSQVITYAARTPLTKAKKGALKDTPIDDLLIALLTVRPPISSLYPN
jgi:hypothetical protein